MAKVIKIEDDMVFIGLDDGGIKSVKIANFNFSPDINDEVEIFETDSTIVVNKKCATESNADSKPDGVNINVSNTNTGPTPVYIANNTKAVNKVIYCVLAFFMGWLGIHKFYAGKVAAGILYAIFFWTCIPAIIAFIEFIIALCKPQDSEGNILV